MPKGKKSLSVEQIASAIIATMSRSTGGHSGVGGSFPEGDQIAALRKAYRDGRLVLVLGAGVSMDLGLPDWLTLLQQLLFIRLNGTKSDHDAAVIADLFARIFSPNALIAARYLEQEFASKQNAGGFLTAIRNALYTNKARKQTALINEICQFCIAPGKSPNLDSIITYNFDDVLESALRNSGLDVPFRSIHASGMNPQPHELAIYHVHGYLPEVGDLSDQNNVVLSEHMYHQQYADIYHWSNLTQINKFKDAHCLFVGVSFFDPNLRRLLDVSKQQRGHDGIIHYCFRRHHQFDSVIEKLESAADDLKPAQRKSTAGQLIKMMEAFEERDLRSFGIGTLWVNDHQEIPKIFQRIRKYESID